MAIDYNNEFNETTGGAFPVTTGKNASGPGATDGTEFVKLFIDDIWGRFQAVLDYAGLTPTGVSESASVSQHIEAIKKGFAVGPGMGVIYWKDGDPSANGDRVLLLNGQGIARANYADLDDAVYVGDGNNATASTFFRATDAAGTSRSTTGTYLILPDTRGYVLRGLDTAASVDPDGASRDLGDIQSDAFQGWQAGALNAATNYYGSYGSDPGTTGARPMMILNSGGQGVANGIYPFNDGTNGIPRTSSESRMTNITTRYGITY